MTLNLKSFWSNPQGTPHFFVFFHLQFNLVSSCEGWVEEPWYTRCRQCDFPVVYYNFFLTVAFQTEKKHILSFKIWAKGDRFSNLFLTCKISTHFLLHHLHTLSWAHLPQHWTCRWMKPPQEMWWIPVVRDTVRLSFYQLFQFHCGFHKPSYPP